MKYINKITKMVVAGLALATTSCSDFADYNEVPDISGQASGKTLYENIMDNPQLSELGQLIAKSGYAETLNQAQSYTFWAPVNGSYDSKALLEQDDKTIIKQFLNQHMAQYMHPISGTVNERIITLNDKHHNFTNVAFDDNPIVEANIPASNGLIHLVNGLSPYYDNLSEYVDNVKGCDNLVKFISDYNEISIDKYKSIPGPLVNGQQTYLDTVWRKSNPVVSRILRAELENEDSTYTMLFPTDAAWTVAYDKIKTDYNFKSGYKYLDFENVSNETPAANITTSNVGSIATSLDAVNINVDHYTDSIVKYQITRNLVYSHNDPYNKAFVAPSYVYNPATPDSIRSTNGRKISNIPDLFAAMGPAEPRSNGFSRKLNDFAFLPYETYEPVISVTSPVRTLGLGDGKYITRNSLGKTVLLTSRDTLFTKNPKENFMVPEFIKRMMMPKSSNFVTWVSTDSVNLKGTSAKPEMDFKLNNTLSTKYHIFVVFMPIQLTQEDHFVYPEGSILRFDMAYQDKDGKQVWYRLNVKGAAKSTDPIQFNSNYINCVELEFEFPLSYFGIDAAPTLFVSLHDNVKLSTSANRRKYDREMRIAGVYMIPEAALPYYKAMKFEY